MVASLSGNQLLALMNEILPLNQIDVVMIPDVRHFQKYDYGVINCLLD